MAAGACNNHHWIRMGSDLKEGHQSLLALCQQGMKSCKEEAHPPFRVDVYVLRKALTWLALFYGHVF